MDEASGTVMEVGVLRAHPPAPIPATDDRAAGDAELVALAQQERRAFAHLYRRYVEDVYRFCDRRLGDREVAEDATATVFKRALERIDACRDGAAFRGWLFAIARNVVNDDFRARRPVAPLDTATEVLDARPSPEDLAVAADERRRIWTLLGHLPADERELIALRLHGFNDKEIAGIVGRSHGTVRNKQSRALDRLRTLLGVAAARTEARRVES